MHQTEREVIADILNSGTVFTREGIERAFSALKERHDQLQRFEALRFTTGEQVTFDARGKTRVGKVIKINSKSVTVEVPSEFGSIAVKWKVAPTLLKKVA